MLKIGLTGGIGSGKSTVSKVFKSLGIPVFNSDEAAKMCYGNEEVKSKVINLLGENSYSNGRLNNKIVAELVFKNKELLDKLNEIIHPEVAKMFAEFCKLNSDKPYVVKEAAILFESGAHKGLDKVITVSAPESLRVDRVAERDGVSRNEIMSRLQHQIHDAERESRSDFVIHNNEAELLIPQILNIDKSLRNIK